MINSATLIGGSDGVVGCAVSFEPGDPDDPGDPGDSGSVQVCASPCIFSLIRFGLRRYIKVTFRVLRTIQQTNYMMMILSYLGVFISCYTHTCT